MKAMIFAAGLGTRLKPLTDTMPKALVPVAGKPMLEHVILKLKASGFDEIIINVHHFADQIIDFLKVNNNFGITIHISDERDKLLDTGGGIKKAGNYLNPNHKEEPEFSESKEGLEDMGDFIIDLLQPTITENFLVHNVDILSDCNLKDLLNYHTRSNYYATLLVSKRNTFRYLLFNEDNELCGWINKKTNEVKPKGLIYVEGKYKEYAYSGIQAVNSKAYSLLNVWPDKFSIIDFYLSICQDGLIQGYPVDDLHLIDIGKPETLAEAEVFLKKEIKHKNY